MRNRTPPVVSEIELLDLFEVSKNDECCIKNDRFCIKHRAAGSILGGDMHAGDIRDLRRKGEQVRKMMNIVLKTRNLYLKRGMLY